ncbi:Spermatogenesis-associated protein 6 [Paragonimus heterotremus]|uniref:Spermatogenesis-associated protein 6 n=1 Tax=Paragonimus heterotremus TaxID=100268 RepID=A0A8J4TH40_9TREM|nr:Spermatogenesis-associated protein 6 [Paragonimus heterotremus]
MAFYSALSACNVVDRLEDERVRIELRQITDVYCGGTLLAYFETTAKELFCPCAHMCVRNLPNNEITMLRTVDFPGISPRIEFTVCSAIKCNSSSQCQISSTQYCEDCFVHRPLVSTPNYHRPTVNSALRCRYAEMAEPKSFFYSDVANHNSRDHRAPLLRPFSAKQRLRPRSTGSGRSPNYNDLYTRGYPSNQLNYPLSKTNVTLSNWDLRERNIRDAQDRCDRYWSLYRFWQSEADRRRTRLI